MKLLNRDQNAKTVKGRKLGYATAILYLAPANLSGYEVCPQRSPGCTAACLNTAGRGAFNKTQQARLARTRWYFKDRQAFMAKLVRELRSHARWCKRKGYLPAVRLNGTSDIPWEHVPIGDEAASGIRRDWPISEPCLGSLSVMELFPEIQFYDYTKITRRALAWAAGGMPKNYHLTFSLAESNDREALDVLRAGGNVAAVFAGDMPASVVFASVRGKPLRMADARVWRENYGFPVVDGDGNDLRHLDARGVVVGLKAKGKARHDTSGFVRG